MLRELLLQTSSKVRVLSIQCRAARRTAILTQNATYEACRKVELLRAGTPYAPAESLLHLAIMHALLEYKTAVAESRAAHDTRMMLDQQMRAAQAEEAEYDYLHDEYLLRYIPRDVTKTFANHIDGCGSREVDADETSPSKVWRRAVDAAMLDIAAMTVFPAPPAKTCVKRQCVRTAESRALEACPCNILEAFVNVDDLNRRYERFRFHPDRFVVCSNEKRMDLQRMASEMFAVADKMYRLQRMNEGE